MPSALNITNLTKKYGSLLAVDNVSLELVEGEIFGLLGPNGAGKTSLISCILSLEEMDAGSISVFGYDITKQPQQAKFHIGLVPQELINHGFFNIEEILTFHSGYFGLLRNKERIQFLLHRLGLWEHRHKKVRQLSGGMKRRLLLAKALVNSPKLLILDEPTAGVDIELRESLWEFVKELRKTGQTVLLTTHYLEEAEELCNRVGVINKGKIIKLDATENLIKHLTRREVVVSLAKPIEIKHQYLASSEGNKKTFRIPYTVPVGQLIQELKIDLSQILDLQIREGNLEDAFRVLLGEAHA